MATALPTLFIGPTRKFIRMFIGRSADRKSRVESG